MSIRSRLIVEHDMCNLISNLKDGILSIPDIKLKFIDDFLFVFDNDDIDYGMEYLYKNNKTLYDILIPLILEYKTFGLDAFVDKESDIHLIADKPRTFLQKVKSFFKKESINDMYREIIEIADDQK